MVKQWQKVFIACALGAFIGSLIALQLNSYLWWIGLIAGMAGGYISYEFREVRKAIPIALHAAGRGSVSVWNSAIAKAKAWLSKPHPFFYPSAIVITPLFVWAVYHFVPYVTQEFVKASLQVSIILLPIFYVEVVMGFVFLAWLALVPFFTFAFIGARAGERCYWQPFVMVEDKEREAHVQKLNEKGYREEPLTYLNVLRWVVIGVAVTIRFFAWTLWKYLAIGVRARLYFIGRFAWHLFKLIHSDERLLCGVDAALGALVGYFTGNALIGALFGGIFGVANFELVSRRLLHLVPTKRA